MNPEFKQSKLERPEKREARLEQPIESLKEGERSIFTKAAEVLENLPGKILEKSRRAKAVAAFALLLEASTLFTEMAWAQESKKYTPKEIPAEPTAEFVLKEQPRLETPFDWKKVVNEINVSYEAPYIAKKEFEAEDINLYNLEFGSQEQQNPKFYKDLSLGERSEAESVYMLGLFRLSAQEFFNTLKEHASELNDKQKLLALQWLGNDLARTYNYDMLKNDKYVEISDEAMVENQGKKEIVFVDYNNVIPTGTSNYKEAMGVIERRNKEIALFISFVGDTKEVLFPVKSYAQETMEKAAGFEEFGKGLSERLETGEIQKERKLEIKFGPEMKEIKLDRDNIGLYYINYQNSGNVYNSLENLNAVRGSL